MLSQLNLLLFKSLHAVTEVTFHVVRTKELYSTQGVVYPEAFCIPSFTDEVVLR